MTNQAEHSSGGTQANTWPRTITGIRLIQVKNTPAYLDHAWQPISMAHSMRIDPHVVETSMI
jgi:hypothetical protein